jgi:GNAT superfamily N-acetyltransferase
LDPALLHAFDVNYWLASAAFMGTSLRGESVESHDLSITSCGFPSQRFNHAFLKHPDGDVARACERAEAYFGAQKLPFFVQVRDDRETLCAPVLRERGYARVDALPVMALSPIPQEPIRRGDRAVPGFEISEVASEADLEDYRITAFAGFGIPVQAARLFLTEAFWRMPGVRLYLGRLDGVAVATSALVSSPGVAGIYWVATHPEFRKRGFGEVVTWAAVCGGARDGLPVACLQASAMGAPVYRRMGFDTPAHYVQYGRPKA